LRYLLGQRAPRSTRYGALCGGVSVPIVCPRWSQHNNHRTQIAETVRGQKYADGQDPPLCLALFSESKRQHMTSPCCLSVHSPQFLVAGLQQHLTVYAPSPAFVFPMRSVPYQGSYFITSMFVYMCIHPNSLYFLCGPCRIRLLCCIWCREHLVNPLLTVDSRSLCQSYWIGRAIRRGHWRRLVCRSDLWIGVEWS
jgi:hypothetical protein